MSPATSTQVRRRQAARREAAKRQQVLNEERRQRDELEVELAADFALFRQEWVEARAALAAAELEMGRVVNRMIDLRVRYPRAAQLLEMPEDELRRLRQLVADSIQGTDSLQSGQRTRDEERSEPGSTRRRRSSRARSNTDASGTVDDGPELDAPGTAMSAGQGERHDAAAGTAETQ
jgi:hypothetical protein